MEFLLIAIVGMFFGAEPKILAFPIGAFIGKAFL
jgi:hypothetical protein